MTSDATKRAVILAAGSGERLKPLTLTSPKCLLPFGDKNNFLKQTISCFLEIGVKEFTIVVGYLKESIIQFVQDTFPQVEVHFIQNPDYRITNSGYSLWLALRQNSEELYFQDADLYCPLPVYQRLHDTLNKNAFLVDTDLSRLNAEAMKVLIDEKKNIQLLSKKIELDAAGGEFIGLGSFSASCAQNLLQSMNKSFSLGQASNEYYEDILNQILPDLPLAAISTNNLPWIEVDTPEDYDELRSQILI